MRRFLSTIAIAAAFAGACATVTENGTAPTQPSNPQPPSVDRGASPPASRPPLAGDCDATKAQWAVGERASDDLLERARVAAEAGSARFVRPNQVITMEYSSARLNLGLDDKEIVRNVRCG